MMICHPVIYHQLLLWFIEYVCFEVHSFLHYCVACGSAGPVGRHECSWKELQCWVGDRKTGFKDVYDLFELLKECGVLSFVCRRERQE